MDSQASLGRYVSQNSKKRVFPSGSSISGQVVEVSPSIKEVIDLETIDVDMEGGHTDVMLIDGNTEPSGKGKEVWLDLSLGHGGSANSRPSDQVQSSKKHCPSESFSQNIGDDFGSDMFYGDDVHSDMYFDDLVYNECSILEKHFDRMDIPPGVEAPIPWMSGPAEAKPVSTTASMSSSSKAPNFPFGREAPLVPTDQFSSWHGSTPVNQPTPFELPSPSLGPAFCKSRLPATGNSKETSLKEQSDSTNLSHGAGKSSNIKGSRAGRKFYLSPANASDSWHSQFIPGASYVPTGPWLHLPPPHPLPSPVSGWMNLPLKMTAAQPPSGFMPTPGGMNSFPPKQVYPGFIPTPNPMNYFPQEQLSSGSVPAPVAMYFPHEMHHPLLMEGPRILNAATIENASIHSGSASSVEQPRDLGESLKNFRLFKKFDTVQDHSDHYFSRHASLDNQASKGCVKRIQEEWKILEKDLPDTIFVRVYETRMDLLRAVIIGADETPYHDGLFFFDVYFPSNYPNVPPRVHYHSFGLRINPNLYDCGKVCLSLLNTWSGRANEKWIPGESTMLQVLVSIQGLILNEKPYFNEPGYARMSGSARGEESSLHYNETTYIYNLKTMVFCMRRPPQHFEDFVLGHFFQSYQDIFAACKAYLDGAQVGTLVRGCVQDVDKGDKSCSETFKAVLGRFIQTLVDTFTKIGVKDCDKFLDLAQRANGVAPVPSTNKT